ncbi:MAG: ABC transporter ATP-binding protein [Actinomycetia bacterium]|nr:ABC transporter ATP-binding protein [Actinomycetes bacterium]
MTIIEVQDLHKRYGDKVAVDDVSFAVDEGEIFGVLGPNGAGKTTTVECLSGLRRPDSGQVRVAGRDPIGDHEAVSSVLGVQLQESQLQPKLKVREALSLYEAFYDDPESGVDLAERLGFTDRLDAPYATLSGGQKQRLSIALALIGRPRAVLLDELTTGLDPQSRRETWHLIREIRGRGVTVVLVTHLMEEAHHLCDRVAVIDRGRVIALDTPTGLIRGTACSTVMSFIANTQLDSSELERQPDVTSVERDGARVIVNGSDDSVTAILSLLAQRRIVAEQLRVTDATLDDAFLNLVDRSGSEGVTT